MNPEPNGGWAELFVRLDTVYDKQPSQLRAAEYRKALADIPFDVLREAVSRHIQRARTYPRISDLRLLADEANVPARKALPPAEHDGERFYTCPDCLDMGWIYQDGTPIHRPRDGPLTVRSCHCVPPGAREHKRYAHPLTDHRRPW